MAVLYDFSLYDDYGWKIRRQDGKRLKAEDIELLRAGAKEISDAIYNLADVYQFIDLKIIYTGGKYIHREPRSIAGAYRPSTNEITVGVRDQDGHPAIMGLAHELGHALDFTSAYPRKYLDQLFDKHDVMKKGTLPLSVVEGYLADNHAEVKRIYAAMLPIGHRNLKKRLMMNSNTEAWARAFEETIAYLTYKQAKAKPITTQPLRYYLNQEGYWDFHSLKSWLAKMVVDHFWMSSHRIRYFAFMEKNPTGLKSLST